ncbi:tungsten cofactor oxidoreductase radical SAM maturase [Desulfitispora alkaliphila]|uniref:tungsten cofactor oxidoreductase radical SAM maturase n=1 Tax=Desulfitispora alkaliphila TaxID=622674 RepID=UPI003D1F947D
MAEEIRIKQGDIIKVVEKKPDVKKIYLEVTNRCNLDCTTCIRHSWKNDQGYMSEQTFANFLEQIDELPQLQTIHFGGFGEPMSHPKILEFLEALKNKGLRLEMISNGYLLDEKMCKGLARIGLSRLVISLDGPDEEEYNKIRVGSEFSQVIQNIETLNRVKQEQKATGLELGIEFVAMKQNIHKLPKLLKLADKLRAGFVIVTNLLPYSEDMVGQELYDGEEDDLMIGPGSSYLLFRAKVPEMKLRTTRKCDFVDDKTVSITWEGNVSPCYSAMHHYSCFVYGRKKEVKPHHFGNIDYEALKDIWMGDEFLKFRTTVNEFHFPSCTDCKYLDGCSMVDDNQLDCWGNSPTCADCLWSRKLILCP